MSEILRTAVRNGITVPTDLSMLGKSIITLDVVVKKLDTNFSIAQWEAPMVEKIVSRKISKKRFTANAKNAALVLEDLLKKLPDSTAAIVENIESGKFGMEVNRGQLAEYEHLLNANSKINSYGTLLSAAIIASALIYQVKDLPRILGLSVAQIGLYGSLFLVLLYLISNRKKG
jgi:ubiquinone biosynthesis protein